MFKKDFLKNRIPVVMEPIRNVRSVSIGIWVKVGSRDEGEAKNGISHFLEHMFFKGTKKRSAKDLAVEIDSIGGELNAFTSREGTTFYSKVRDEHLPEAVALLSDIFLNSTLNEEDIEKEKGIIIEEIKMVEDSPDEYIHDLLNQSIWGAKGLGQSVLGRRETIKAVTRKDLLQHIRRYYNPQNIVVAAAGNFDIKRLIGLLNSELGRFKRNGRIKTIKKNKCHAFQSNVTVMPKDLSEVHICLGIKALPQNHEKRYALYILNSILGAGVSSRLFQEIREQRGLAYSIYSYVAPYFDTGILGVYAGTGKRNAKEVVQLTIEELSKLKGGITEEELRRAKEQLKGSIILGLESTSSRMSQIARQEIYFGRYFSQDDLTREIEKTTMQEVTSLSKEMLKKENISLAVMGRVRQRDFEKVIDL